MDYFFRSKVEIRNVEDLEKLLAFEGSVKSITLKNGEIRRLTFEDDKPDVFLLSLRTRNPREIRSLYNGFKEMLVTGDMPGYVAWHECRHDANLTACTWNEEFYHPPLGGEV